MGNDDKFGLWVLLLGIFFVMGLLIGLSYTQGDVACINNCVKSEVVQLNHDNYYKHVHVTDYMCTEGVHAEKYPESIYLSTWEDAMADEGTCIIKYKNK